MVIFPGDLSVIGIGDLLPVAKDSIDANASDGTEESRSRLKQVWKYLYHIFVSHSFFVFGWFLNLIARKKVNYKWV